MRHSITAAALAAVLGHAAAHAAQDPGLTLHDTRGDTRGIGVGVQATVAIPLGGGATTARSDGPRLSLRAGPSLTQAGSTVRLRDRTRVAPLAELALRPRHSTTLSLAGQPLAVSYASPALREAAGPPDGPRSNLSTLGYVAIGVGVAVILGGVLAYDHLRDIDRNSD